MSNVQKLDTLDTKVEKVALPVGSLVGQVYSKVDYADAYRVKVPKDADLLTIGRVFLTSSPDWIVNLMRLRDFLVKFIGLKTAKSLIRPSPKTISFEPGTRAGIFRVYERAADEVLMGEDDRHLNFRTSLVLQPQADFSWAVFSTVVHYNGWLGRAYFLPLRPFHNLVVPALLRSGARKMQREQE